MVSTTKVFLGLQIAGGHIGLPIVMIAAITAKNPRDPTFWNFCVTWTLSSVLFSLLLYNASEPIRIEALFPVGYSLCQIQAALTGTVQVLTAAATLSLIIRLWIGLRSTIHADLIWLEKRKVWINAMLVAFPYILFVPLSIIAVSGVRKKTEESEFVEFVVSYAINFGEFYCRLVSPIPYIETIYIMTLILLSIGLLFDVHVIYILTRHWLELHNLEQDISFSVLIRVLIFSVYRAAVTVTYIIVLIRVHFMPILCVGNGICVQVDVTLASLPNWVELLQATIPSVGALILGMNMNFVNSVRRIWKRVELDFVILLKKAT